MGKVSNWLWGASIGAALMYLYDPNNGRTRRSLLKDQFIGFRNNAGKSLDTAVNDLQNRMQGFQSEMTGMMSGKAASDRVLEERVRSKLGYLTHHAGSIRVSVSNGHATLNGDALAGEEDNIVSGVSKVRGIYGVDNQLKVHESADNIPGLQGIDQSKQAMQGSAQNWSPSTRLIAGTGGGAMVLTGGLSKGLTGRLMSLGGWALLLRSLTNLPFGQMLGLSQSRRVINIQRAFNIPAPIDKVYNFFANFENFPRFMSHIESVKRMGGNRSHWVAKGPAGTSVEWDAIETQAKKNQMIAWQSTPDSEIKTTGAVRFKKMSEDSTQVNIHLYYNPPAGALGHAVAAFFGKDPESAMIDDMIKVKSLLTEGKTTVEGEEVTYKQKNQPQQNR